MIACYVRVSTTGQNECGQRREIDRWLAGHDIEGVRWYVDKERGDTLERPSFATLQQDIFSGEILSINGLVATTSEFIELETGKAYEVAYSDNLGGFIGPYTIVNSENKTKSFTLSSGDLLNAFTRDSSMGTAIQTGSRYIVSEVGESDPDQYVVSQKDPASGGNVQLTLRQYDPRTYAFD